MSNYCVFVKILPKLTQGQIFLICLFYHISLKILFYLMWKLLCLLSIKIIKMNYHTMNASTTHHNTRQQQKNSQKLIQDQNYSN
jgi:hypothetical protein